MKSKKKLLLLGVGAMGALAMGVGATSTFAWFVANSVTASYATKQISDQIGQVTSSVELGNFKITPVFTKQVTENIVLTNNTGDTYVYAEGQTASGDEITAGVGSNVKHGSFKIKLDVTYSGNLATKEEVNALWQSSAVAVDVAITDESVDRTVYADMASYNAAKDPDVDAETWASMTEAEKEKTPGLKIGNKAGGAGLKFNTTEFSGTSYAGTDVTLEFNLANLKAVSFTSDPSDEDNNGATPNTVTARTTAELTVFVAIKGINGLVQDATEHYTIGAEASAH